MDSFLYIWNDNTSGKMYIGVHKGTDHDGYVCSSKTLLEEYNKRSEDFSRVIVARGAYPDMLRLENMMLEKVDAMNNDLYYNRHNGIGVHYAKHSNESKRKMREVKVSNSAFIAMATQRLLNNHYTKQPNYVSPRLGVPGPNKDIPHSEETKRKMAERWEVRRNNKTTCEHCSKSCTAGMYVRWHGPNCKHRTN